jgi:hypothetical protein
VWLRRSHFLSFLTQPVILFGVWVLDYAELGSIRNIIGRLAKHSLVNSKITLIMAYEIMYLSNHHGKCYIVHFLVEISAPV